MEFPSAARGNVVVGDLDQTLAPKALVMSAVHDFHGQFSEPLHGFDIGRDVAFGQVVEQRSIVDRVPREERSRSRFPESDTSARMAGQVEDLEMTIAEIDRVVHEQEAADPMPLKSLVEDVYAQVPRHLRVQYNDFIRVAERFGDAQPGDGQFPL